MQRCSSYKITMTVSWELVRKCALIATCKSENPSHDLQVRPLLNVNSNCIWATTWTLGFFNFNSQRVELPKPGAQQSLTATIQETFHKWPWHLLIQSEIQSFVVKFLVGIQEESRSRSWSMTLFNLLAWVCIPRMTEEPCLHHRIVCSGTPCRYLYDLCRLWTWWSKLLLGFLHFDSWFISIRYSQQILGMDKKEISVRRSVWLPWFFLMMFWFASRRLFHRFYEVPRSFCSLPGCYWIII